MRTLRCFLVSPRVHVSPNGLSKSKPERTEASTIRLARFGDSGNWRVETNDFARMPNKTGLDECPVCGAECLYLLFCSARRCEFVECHTCCSERWLTETFSSNGLRKIPHRNKTCTPQIHAPQQVRRQCQEDTTSSNADS